MRWFNELCSFVFDGLGWLLLVPLLLAAPTLIFFGLSQKPEKANVCQCVCKVEVEGRH